jgi:TPP-dependent pyruvate/acetoin dehydrogenase alpha subunit
MSTAKPRKKSEPVRAASKAESKATATAPASDGTSAAMNRELLYSMLLQRRFEERCAEMYAMVVLAASATCTLARKPSPLA